MPIQPLDPFDEFRKNAVPKDDFGTVYPGPFIAGQMKDAHAIITAASSEIKKGKDVDETFQEIIDTGLQLINWWSHLLEAPNGKIVAENEDVAQRERIIIICAFIAGLSASRLTYLTASGGSDESVQETIALIRNEFPLNASRARSRPVQQRRMTIREIWVSGKYTSREICADEEWEYLGFPSRRAAREALFKTPEPLR